MQTNKVTYNLMSFTGFKSMLLFSYLLQAPRSYEEIKEYFASHEYLNETISIDTLRVYIYSLERLGCVIVKGKKAEGSKYTLVKHPFGLKINDEQIKSLVKIFKTLLKSIDLDDLISLTKFFDKIANEIKNEELKSLLENISPLKKIKPEVLQTLLKACERKDEINITYKSPNSGIKYIDVLAQKLILKNGKIYLQGMSPKYKGEANFILTRIIEPPAIKLEKTIEVKDEPVVIGFELYDKNIELSDNEKIISEDSEKLVVEMTTENTFYARQRVLSFGKNCKVLYPQSFKEDVISTLKKMKEAYIAEKI